MTGLHFVLPRRFEEYLSALPEFRLGHDYPYWLGGAFNWVAQSYLVLRKHREGLTISCAPVPSRINVAHTLTWQSLVRRAGEFRVSIRADYPPREDSDFEIVQNPTVGPSPRRAYLPYWPIPGIIPRNTGRDSVRNVAFAGRDQNGNLSSRLAQIVRDQGLNYQITAPDRWHDMSEVDVLVAVRKNPRHPYRRKPPSKLLNAWAADVPLIAGNDSAFRTIGQDQQDYLRVTSIRSFARSLQALAEDPSLYESLVSNGRQRRLDFTEEAIASQWLRVIEEEIGPSFEAGPSPRRLIGLPPAALKNTVAAGIGTAKRSARRFMA